MFGGTCFEMSPEMLLEIHLIFTVLRIIVAPCFFMPRSWRMKWLLTQCKIFEQCLLSAVCGRLIWAIREKWIYISITYRSYKFVLHRCVAIKVNCKEVKSLQVNAACHLAFIMSFFAFFSCYMSDLCFRCKLGRLASFVALKCNKKGNPCCV